MRSYLSCGLLCAVVACTIEARASEGEFSLVPVNATGGYTINGNEIVVSPGARVTLEIHVSDWDPDSDGDPKLRGYQAQIDSSGFTTGVSGSLTIPMIPIPCTSDDDCVSVGSCEASGFCTQTGAFIIDESHVDFVFRDLNTISMADTSQPDVRLGSLVVYLSDVVRDVGSPKYSGTLIVDVSQDAYGTFTVGFITIPQQTFLMDDDFGSFLPAVLTPAMITVTNDCNGNGVPDDEDIAAGTSDDCNNNGMPDECEPDCNGNGVPDDCDVESGFSNDCNDNGMPDECEPDCNENGTPDDCDIADGLSDDCDTNGIPDECELVDCNENGVLDICDVANGTSEDCNDNDTPDECEEDCNHNGRPDDCDIADGIAEDTNGNGVPDECEIAVMALVPLDATVPHTINDNEIIVTVGSPGAVVCVTMEVRVSDWDFNQDGDPALRSYQASFDPAGFTSGESGELYLPATPIPCNVDSDCPAWAAVCEGGFCDASESFTIDESHPDYVFSGLQTIAAADRRWPEIRLGSILLASGAGVVDPGEPKYAGRLVLEVSFDATGTFTVGFLDTPGSFLSDSEGQLIGPLSLVPTVITLAYDCNDNGVPDCTDIVDGTSQDCNGNGVPDECEADCNNNGIADECDIAEGTSDDCNENEVPDECEPDCNGNGVADECDISDGTSMDCNQNGVPDVCELIDCNGNGILDSCDISDGTSGDCDENGVPDECEFADCNDNGIGDNCDIADGLSDDINANGVPDECEPLTIALVPVSATGINFINGNEITVLPGAEAVTLELHVANWDLDRDGDPLLYLYQATIDTSGYHSGLSGSIGLATISCETHSDCFGEATCGNQVPGQCDVSLQDHPAVYIDTSRPDFVFSGVETIVAVDVGGSSQRFAGFTYNDDDAVPDTGLSRYIGTLILNVSSDASGTFTIGLLPDPDTYLLGNESYLDFIGPPGLVPVSIAVLSDCNDNGSADEADISSGVSLDCNDNGFPDECDTSYGVSGDCNDNMIPDECEPDDDCNSNGVQDFCDIVNGTSTDFNANGVPDECEYPPAAVSATGGRYLTVIPPAVSDPIALLVTSPDYPCLSEYVIPGPGIARLGESPVFLTPDEWGTVLVADAEIVPDTEYEIRVRFEIGVLSFPVTTRTAIWGDTVGGFVDNTWTSPDGVVYTIDVVAILDGFKHLSCAPPTEWIDLFPQIPDGRIDIIDAVMSLDGFKHLPYAFDLPCQ